MASKLLYIYQCCLFVNLAFCKKAEILTSSKLFADSDSEIRFLGWTLLGLWITTIIYMTRDFFFPSLFAPKLMPISLSTAEIQKYSHLNTVLEESESTTQASETVVRHRSSGSLHEQVFL